jgi:hypothetical protein
MDLFMLREYEKQDAQQENSEKEAAFNRSSKQMARMFGGSNWLSKN